MKNIKGFSAVEGLLLLVLFGLIGVVGYYVYNANKNATDTYSYADSSIESSNQNNWKPYRSIAEGFTIKLPSSWKLITEKASGNNKEIVNIEGPNNFRLHYHLTKYDPSYTKEKAKQEAELRGDTTQDTSTSKVINTLHPKNYPRPLYVILTSFELGEKGGPVNTLSLSQYKSKEEHPLGYAGYYLADNNKGYLIDWYGSYSKPAPSYGPIGMEPSKFKNSAEVKTAIKILKSITY